MSAGLPEIPPLELEGDVKACCAQLYDSEAVRWLLGDQRHPGGERLTLRLAELAGVRAGERVVDVACGTGASARLLAAALGVDVLGVDLAPESVRRAREAADAAAIRPRAKFVEGDAERLPVGDGAFDVALSECSLCTFPDKPAAVAEMARVLGPHGRIAIADVAADATALPPALRTAAAQVACVADALPAEGYAGLLRSAGFAVITREDAGAELVAMIDRVEARLRIARMLAPPGEQRERVREAVSLVRMAAGEARRGTLSYMLLVAERA